MSSHWRRKHIAQGHPGHGAAGVSGAGGESPCVAGLPQFRPENLVLLRKTNHEDIRLVYRPGISQTGGKTAGSPTGKANACWELKAVVSLAMELTRKV